MTWLSSLSKSASVSPADHISKVKEGIFGSTNSKSSTASTATQISTSQSFANVDEEVDYENLQHLAMKREIKVTIKKGTQAGIVAGLSVMTGVIVAGPVGAMAGGAVGTAMAVSLSRNTVSLQSLLAETPEEKRHQVIQVFRESFHEEFIDTVQSNPELKLLLGGMTILGVTRYAVDRNLLQGEQLKRVDGILKNVF
eukprot:CAMPEP_0172445442 /NCGR_PEP_ID=MMETSP1065-20121228/5264_1 /TAXON_ID=265537 /ORGANISM="Amphiprora paludosa, Strain CCMP125" /LENGTH=196 /DNA_ID=CAMNT_0013196283 /DNA_START=79 /DNA_END=669 /DNA_ORIENTATION=-